MNFIQVLGNLGSAPEKKQSKNGKEFYTFSVASNYKKNGEAKTSWYRITLFEFNEKFMHFLKGGSSVVVIGTLGEPRIYQDKQGESKVSLDIVASSINFSPFGGDKKEDQLKAYNNQGVQSGQQQYKQQVQPAFDSDLPF